MAKGAEKKNAVVEPPEIIKLRMSHALYNASMLGFYKVLVHKAKSDNDDEAQSMLNEDHGTELWFPPRLLQGIEEAWIDEMIDEFGKATKCRDMLDRYEALRGAVQRGEGDAKAARELFGAVKDKMKSASYKSAAEICAAAGDTYNAPEALKAVEKPSKADAETLFNALKLVIEYIERNKRVFMMKDMAYAVINKYWQNVAFLNRQTAKIDMQKCIFDTFVEPALRAAAEPQKKEYECFECGRTIGKKNMMFATAWLCDFGIDETRKSSNYRDFRPDDRACPICALCYSCMPLGFQVIGAQGFFINNNESFAMLKSANSSDGETVKVGTDSPSDFRRHIARKYLSICSAKQANKQLSSIQAIIRKQESNNTPEYVIQILSGPQMRALTECKNEFDKLTNAYITEGKTIRSVFDEALNNLMLMRSQNSLIFKLLGTRLANGERLYDARALLKIQAYSKGGCDMKKKDAGYFSRTDMAMLEGSRVRAMFDASEGDIDNKLRGYIYKLLNCAKGDDREGFMDTVARFYIGMGRAMPSEMLSKMFQGQEAFVTLAQAYIIGLGGGWGSNEKGQDKE